MNQNIAVRNQALITIKNQHSFYTLSLRKGAPKLAGIYQKSEEFEIVLKILLLQENPLIGLIQIPNFDAGTCRRTFNVDFERYVGSKLNGIRENGLNTRQALI